MPFELPTKSFDYVEHAKNKVLRANQLEEMILQQFKSSYEDFWGVGGSDQAKTIKVNPEATPPTEDAQVTTFVGTGSRYSVEEMQSILNVLGGTAIQIMTSAAGLVQFIDAAYPGVLQDRYRSTAFNYTVGQNGIALTGLSDAWAVPPAPEVLEAPEAP